MDLILNHDRVDVNARDNVGDTALKWAADVGRARMLLDHEDIEVTMECEEAEVEEVRDLICQYVNDSREKRDANK